MSERADADFYKQLAAYRKCVDRIRDTWPGFAARRRERLQQGGFGAPVEKIAENILEDLFTTVLDWSLADVNLQVGRADVVLSGLGIKRLVLEIKRPGSLIWRRPAVDSALSQARRYAANQRVGAVAVSDATMLYAADVVEGGLRDRVLVALDTDRAPEALWWISVHGIYRPCSSAAADFEAVPSDATTVSVVADGELRHPKYALGMQCFAYVGAADNTRTWKLPYRLADGAPDPKRLPKAIQCILSNYRGARVDIPRAAVAEVLVRLGIAAAELRKMPCQNAPTADAYTNAHQALEQLNRLSDVGCCGGRNQ
ncbi:hypothetical protein BMW24_022495 [Mycobacterium heckeshornense]|uniref:Uncharacterized protein n=1 Tax=Mycobacterium heckeshornense TaxID=110505 RepID=A0A2G8AWW2_9MYCO|nr:hypothetical protein [Mycobacterium heckeshornense]KMV23288.1 hypothetical protein ACT16_06285 [Mycobacterium heckeshornense]MCV7032827.1 hypothetical protein [Mycobacterium heckeshornense]PIJ30010.1 hypothetical protein BMW24_022495 [Mycobacterium heckeshornense]BCO35467.1 hypothetical protein MHEC_19000 [Mycobacterium heckeshornense]